MPTRQSNIVGPVVLVYAVMALAAAAWCLRAGRPVPLAGPPATDRALPGFLAGALVAAVVVAGSRVAHARWAPVRDLSLRLRAIVGDMTGAQIVVVAAASSLGEEAFFRGAMQPSVGLLPTALCFGFVHLPLDRLFLILTGFATGMGFVLGALAAWEGGLVGAVTAHFGVNWLNLLHLCRLPSPSGGADALQG